MLFNFNAMTVREKRRQIDANECDKEKDRKKETFRLRLTRIIRGWTQSCILLSTVRRVNFCVLRLFSPWRRIRNENKDEKRMHKLPQKRRPVAHIQYISTVYMKCLFYRIFVGMSQIAAYEFEKAREDTFEAANYRLLVTFVQLIASIPKKIDFILIWPNKAQ